MSKLGKLSLCLLVPTAMTFCVSGALAQDSIEQSFNNFNNSLDNQSNDMQAARQQSESNEAQRNLQNMQSNQDTENAANQQFQNGQQNMVDGGGAYNSQGFIWGAPWGGMGGGMGGVGNNFTGGINSALGADNMVPNLPSTSWSGDPVIRGPRQGYNGVLRSNYGPTGGAGTAQPGAGRFNGTTGRTYSSTTSDDHK